MSSGTVPPSPVMQCWTGRQHLPKTNCVQRDQHCGQGPGVVCWVDTHATCYVGRCTVWIMLRTFFRQRTIPDSKNGHHVLSDHVRNSMDVYLVLWMWRRMDDGQHGNRSMLTNQNADAPCGQRAHIRNRICARVGHQCTSRLSFCRRAASRAGRRLLAQYHD